MFCCCDTSSKKDAINVMPVADESVPAISFQQVDNSAPSTSQPASPSAGAPLPAAKREFTREQTLDEKEKLQNLIRTFVKEAVAGLTVMRVDVDVATSASLALDKKLKVMQVKGGGTQVDIPLVGVQIALLKDSPKAAARNPDETVVSIVSKDPALDWLVQFGSAKTASDFVIALKVLHEAAKKAA